MDSLTDAVMTLNNQSSLRAAVLTGQGDYFSSGGQIDWLLSRCGQQEPEAVVVARMRHMYGRGLSLRRLRVPVIAAVNGPCYGAAAGIAVGACDIRVAHPQAHFSFNFVRMGLHPGMASTFFLPRLVGPAKAAEMLLTGRIVASDEAYDCGLVSRISDEPLKEALRIAEEICKSGPLAVQSLVDTLRSMNEAPATFTVSSTKSHNLALSKKKNILGRVGE